MPGREAQEQAASRLVAELRRVREATVALAEPLSPEDQSVQSMPDASPTRWHLAHTSWFFEALVLSPHLRGYAPFDLRFGELFNSYYQALGPRHPRPQRGVLSRPGTREVLRYREHVDAALGRLLSSRPSAEALAMVELGLHHEQQHQELILTDILHALSQNPLAPSYRGQSPGPPGPVRPLRWLSRPEGVYELGAGRDGFSFDNERPRHRVFVPAFELGDRLVTCGEFRAFVEDGGYRRPALWLSDGWDAVQAQRWTGPLYWHLHGGEHHRFTLHGRWPLRDDEPVCHVSYYEADAYARWAGARLPTECEWEVAAQEEPVLGNFLESGRLTPSPARASHQLFGDVWQWTSSAYGPYPGFRPFEGAAAEYNGKFMCNQLVLRGGSCASPRAHLRASYRNFFPPWARWQFSGLRLARDR